MNRLRGLTWKHDRGLAPLLATARAFAEKNPGISIEWEARSLHEFGDVSVAGVAGNYDMIVIDHPFMGDVARDRFLVPLDELLDAETLSTLRDQSVGYSHQSYFFEGHQWALAIDAAAQVSGFRADLLDREGATVPRSWEEVSDLAKLRPGFVTLPLLPLDTMMCFFSLCANAGCAAFSCGSERMVDADIGAAALVRLRALAKSALDSALASNPIAIWERMSTSDDIGYCPLAFGYSNYAREGYRRARVSFTDVPRASSGEPRGATLGGAGLAITTACQDRENAAAYARWIASAECQRSLYVDSGGQPGNRMAWVDSPANDLTGGFFQSTLATLENAFVRPRYAGFIELQTAAAQVVWKFLQNDRSPTVALREMDDLFRANRAQYRDK